jgi:hypothetical protein
LRSGALSLSGRLDQVIEIISRIRETGESAEFRRRSRDFSRDGVLSGELLIALLLFMAGDANRRGYRHLLDAFWDECRSFGIALPSEQPVSAAALCQARDKVTSKFLRHALGEVATMFETTFHTDALWRGRRVFAVDGTKINLRRSPELHSAFGTPSGAYCPQVLVSALVNIVNKVPCDVVVAPFASSERQLLLEHLHRLRPGDILVLDRGYPSFDLIHQLTEAGIDFVIRVPATHTFKAIDVFRESGGDDYRVLVEPPTDSPKGMQPIEARAAHWIDGKEEMYVLTSLRQRDITRSQLSQLYRMRWNEEEFFKLIKGHYLDQQQLHSKTQRGVVQEIHVLFLFVALSRFLLAAAAREADANYQDLSPKSGVLGFLAYVTRLFVADDSAQTLVWLRQVLQRIVRTRDPRRPLRSFPRRSFKPGPRWGPHGRKGG